MQCNHDWTIKIRDLEQEEPFELRPIEMSLKIARKKYDFCRAKFPFEVGRHMRVSTRYSDGQLSTMKPAEVCYNGEPIQQLLFRPDWVDYGKQFTRIQFHDLHKSLSNDTIDMKRNDTTLQSVYKDLLSKDSNNLIKGLEFKFPSEQPTKVESVQATLTAEGTTEVEGENGEDFILTAGSSIDFENISIEQAITSVNKKFGLRSWVNKNGIMVVGLPQDKDTRHLAAANDERVWRFKEPNVSHSREKIKKAIVWGPWVESPGVGGAGDAVDEFGSWFVGGKGSADVRAMGVAERTDIDEGQVIYVENKDAEKDSLPEVARLVLKEEIKDNNGGTVEIDPDLSGTQISELTEASPGQFLHLVPDDALYDSIHAGTGQVGSLPDNPDAVCGDHVNNEAYLISEIEHKVTEDGEWQMSTDIGMFPDVEISSFASFFDPDAEEWVKADKITDDDELKDTGFFEDH